MIIVQMQSSYIWCSSFTIMYIYIVTTNYYYILLLLLLPSFIWLHFRRPSLDLRNRSASSIHMVSECSISYLVNRLDGQKTNPLVFWYQWDYPRSPAKFFFFGRVSKIGHDLIWTMQNRKEQPGPKPAVPQVPVWQGVKLLPNKKVGGENMTTWKEMAYVCLISDYFTNRKLESFYQT